jgi:hypothetical protein
MKRVILKKTTYFNKNHKGLSKRITRYLENYVDEVGKAAQKRGEPPWKKSGESQEPRWLLPIEKTGVFYTGGFLGEETSPGAIEANKQRGWIRRFTARYVRALEKCPKRRSDGYRFVMSLAPEAVADLTKANISCDQAMREIWRTTMELYKERHGWNNPKEDVAWIAGAHHDTDNAHLHVLLFPTTKSGSLLRTNNARGKERVDDLNELIAMANIATEIFWRELLPLQLQSQEFKKALEENPDQEPPLPTIESFKARSGIPGKPREESEVVAKPILLLDSKFKEDKDLEYGEISILSRIKRKLGSVRGRMQLRATVAIALKWANKKLKFFGVVKSISDKSQATKTKSSLIKEFPQEAQDIENLLKITGLVINRRAEKTLKEITENDEQYSAALLARVAGDLESNSIEEGTIIDWSGRLANAFEGATQGKESQAKLQAILKEGEATKSQRGETEKQTLAYRRLKRAIERALNLNSTLLPMIEPALKCLDKIIRGSKRLTLVFEARTNEANNSVRLLSNGKLEPRIEKREWALEKTPTGFEFQVKENEGKPWPPHLDPDTVIEPLKDIVKRGEMEVERDIEIPRIKKKSTIELTDIEQPIYKTDKEIEEESPLELILRLKGRKNLFRKKEALDTMKRYRRLSRDIGSQDDTEAEDNLEMNDPEIDIR